MGFDENDMLKLNGLAIGGAFGAGLLAAPREMNRLWTGSSADAMGTAKNHIGVSNVALGALTYVVADSVSSANLKKKALLGYAAMWGGHCALSLHGLQKGAERREVAVPTTAALAALSVASLMMGLKRDNVVQSAKAAMGK
jgi:hypothetical protein